MSRRGPLFVTATILVLFATSGVGQDFAPLRKENVPSTPFDARWTTPAADDVDGDGDVDVLWSDGRLLENLGAGTFRAWLPGSRIALVGTVASLFDLDGDGDPDVVEADPFNARLALHVNDGQGRFALRGTIAGDVAVTVALDVDNDGDGDLLQYGAIARRVLRNDGALPFVEILGALPPHVLLFLARPCDIDGDGDQDLAVATLLPAGPGLALWANDGTGHFVDRSATSLPVGLPPTLLLWTTDVDADGDVDLLYHAGRLRLLINDGGGRFGDETSLRLPATMQQPTAYELHASDFDRDGDVDLAQPGVPLLINQGGGRFAYDPRAQGAYPDSIDASFDVDGDGDPDLLTGGDSLAWNDGSGRVRPEYGAIADGGAVGFGRTADLDGDGDVDLVAGPGRILANDGQGRFVPIATAAIPTLPERWNAVVPWDADADGDLDLLLPHDAGTSLWENVGELRFRLAGARIMPLSVHWRVGGQLVPTDVDSDGDLDLLYLGDSPGAHPPWLLRNDGTGNPTLETGAVQGTFGLPDTLAVADVDGDGDDDVVFSDIGRGAPEAWVLRNDGTGSFGGQALVGGARAIVALADLDGDGDTDLVSADGGPPGAELVLAVHTNDGTGGFSQAASFRQVTRSTARQIRTPDLDGDGDVDVVVDGSTPQFQGSWIRFFVNDGRGNLTPTPGDVELDEVRLLDVADLDRDGDVDLVGATGLHANLLRQVRTPLAARLGFSFPVQVWGPPQTGAPNLATVFAAPGMRTKPRLLPPFGTWFLDEATAFGVLTIVLPPSGAATLPLGVPNVAALAGGTVHFQAALNEPAGAVRLTNATGDVLLR
ncbi:MAG: VCBS repeat-containing protein [Planctomycetes bacterium]|nr:VCBS repeat-containing protein [Planctomycetota bacterium]